MKADVLPTAVAAKPKKPSLRAQLINRYLRLRMKTKPLHLIGADELRFLFEQQRMPIGPKAVAVELVELGPVSGEWNRPKNARATILYLHGGAYVFGSPRLYRPFTSTLAVAGEADVFSLRYRLAPESRCPAAIEDAVKAYEWLLALGISSREMVIGGDSAGGGLAIATLQALRAKGAPMPAGAFVFSPWTDLAATGGSIVKNARSDCMFQEIGIREGAERYRGDLDPRDPRVSPLYGDFRGLPPLLVFASEAEMLYDDSARLIEKARAAGVAVHFETRAGLCHVWPMFSPLFPEAKEAVATVGEFVRTATAAGAERSAA